MRLTCQKAYYIKAAIFAKDYPNTLQPEIALIGRSNVGKSSLLNSLFGCKLAKTSSTPGKTRYIHFFSLDDQVTFVDLPGYGYAAGKQDQWEEMISTYLTSREQLKLLLLLLDSRHAPSELDLQMIRWLEVMHFKFIVVLTKCDKLSANQLEQQTIKILKPFGEQTPPFVHYSSHRNEGRKKLLFQIEKHL